MDDNCFDHESEKVPTRTCKKETVLFNLVTRLRLDVTIVLLPRGTFCTERLRVLRAKHQRCASVGTDNVRKRLLPETLETIVVLLKPSRAVVINNGKTQIYKTPRTYKYY